jgi:hypothetical protein
MAILLALYAIALALACEPFDLGRVRVAGVSIVWWYTFAVAPALAAVTVAILPLRDRG